MLGMRVRRGFVAAVLSAALAVGLLGPVPAAQARYEAGEVLFHLQDPRINESSGVVAARRTPGVLFTHNDSAGAPQVFAVGSAGETLATFDVAGGSNFDWEDMAAGPGPDGTPRLFLADIGDNNRARLFLYVYEIDEPSVTPGGDAVVPVVRQRTLRYADGPHDAEAIVVDPANGQLFVITKELHGVSGVYTVLSPPVAPGAPELLEQVGAIPLAAHVRPDAATVVQDVRSGMAATGADWSADRSRVVIGTYVDAFEWTLEPEEPLDVALQRAPERVVLPAVPQGEAIAYTLDSAALITTTEGANTPVHLLRRS